MPDRPRRSPRLLMLWTLTLTLGALVPLGAGAQALDVQVVKDSRGWKLEVDGEAMAVKGVVWSFTPLGENYTYNLWKQPDAVILRTIDTDLGLMKKLGVNAVRLFSSVPPKWVEYIYDKYGIAVMINDLLGRYGVTVDGRWRFPTDYSDPATRKALVAQALKVVETYKDTRGVLMFLWGNESNYGLEWKSTEIENLPEGERWAKKAEYLYSLFDEVIVAGHQADGHHPEGIVNGDLQYLDLIRRLTPHLDLLGVNAYRGPRSGDAFYTQVREALDKPVIYTEFGCDAFNALTGQEDQLNQARFLKEQWAEVYRQAWGQGREGNCLGGFVFEWVDEWWKHGQSFNLTVHDTEPTWRHGAYAFDYAEGRNNMNEEWFGIVGQSPGLDAQGLNRRLPRAATAVLGSIWALDPLTATPAEVEATLAATDVERLGLAGITLNLQDSVGRTGPVTAHGSVTGHTFVEANSVQWAATYLDSLWWRNQVTNLFTVEAKPSEDLALSLTFRAGTPAVAGTLSPAFEGARPTRPVDDPATAGTDESADPFSSTNRLAPWSDETFAELYRATLTFRQPGLDLTAHYHDGHGDWVGEGDYFQMLPQSYDLVGTDRSGSKAPFGVEAAFHQGLEGLKVYGGPEPFAGALPSVFAKYQRRIGAFDLALVHQEQLAKATTDLAGRTPDLNRWSSLWGRWTSDFGTVDLGTLVAKPDRVGDPGYLYAQGGHAYQFTASDALALKTDLTLTSVPYLTFHGRGLWAGPLADLPAWTATGGSQLADSGSGNRLEGTLDASAGYGPWGLKQTVLYRRPLVGPENRDGVTSHFYVYANRRALQFETLASYNPGGVGLFDWNTADRMDAAFAGFVSLLWNADLGPTDLVPYQAANGALQAFGAPLPATSSTWSLKSRWFGDPGQGWRWYADLGAGRAQTWDFQGGQDTKETLWQSAAAQAAWGRFVAGTEVHVNDFGPEGWQRDQGWTYPLRWDATLAWSFVPHPSFLDQGNRIGLKVSQWAYRASMGPSSPDGATTFDTTGQTSRTELDLFLSTSY